MWGRKPDIVEDVERYHLWYIPHMPIDVPMVRPRERALPWRVGLLESIRNEGMKHPILVYGHSPKGAFNMARWGHAQEGRDPSMYIAFGTNRYWALKQLGKETMEVILSLNKGQFPPSDWGNYFRVPPYNFKLFAPEGRVFVQEHGFGWKPNVMPEEEFGGSHSETTSEQST